MKLNEETWARVYPWLDKAQDVPAAKLQEWLDRIVAEQPEVGIPLREILTQSALFEDDEFFAHPARIPADRHSRVGQQIGAYTIDTLLADGGMGEVWLAHRSDGHFEGKFAVKLLRIDTFGAKALERFKREGRVLARLIHPNIARLIDAGATSDRQPFLVLEFIDGEHIDQYCRSRSLSTRSRVQLFMDVLGAIAHAHTNLVIHRDIKPSNVLVTPEGIVKLLDFGIAKLVGPEVALEEGAQLTRVEEIALTPSYAAPEQILGEPLSTATDVYISLVQNLVRSNQNLGGKPSTLVKLMRSHISIIDRCGRGPANGHAQKNRRQPDSPGKPLSPWLSPPKFAGVGPPNSQLNRLRKSMLVLLVAR